MAYILIRLCGALRGESLDNFGFCLPKISYSDTN